MDEISQEKLLETYEKFMKIRTSMSKANKRYLLTDKGKQKKNRNSKNLCRIKER